MEAPDGAPLATGTAPSPAPRSADRDSQRWLEELGSEGGIREEAIARLHALLLRAARFEVNRRRAGLAHVRGDELDDLAHQSADDAVVAVLSKLASYRGESRFTTWVYKFALLEAAVKLRRRAWRDREIPLEPEEWSLLGDSGAPPHEDVENSELLRAIGEVSARSLTPHQRHVLMAVAVNDVPIDVLAERLGSTRGALYKTVHDARRKLRAELALEGLGPDGGRQE